MRKEIDAQDQQQQKQIEEIKGEQIVFGVTARESNNLGIVLLQEVLEQDVIQHLRVLSEDIYNLTTLPNIYQTRSRTGRAGADRSARSRAGRCASERAHPAGAAGRTLAISEGARRGTAGTAQLVRDLRAEAYPDLP